MGKRARKSGFAVRLIWQIKSIISRLLIFASPKAVNLYISKNIGTWRGFSLSLLKTKT